MTNPSFHTWSTDRRLKGLVFLVLVLTAIALVAYSYLTFKSGKYVNNYGPITISVRGVGEVTKVPDIASFSFNVYAVADDAVSAQADSAKKTNAIIVYLKEQGVAETDIKTLGYNLAPRYQPVSPRTDAPGAGGIPYSNAGMTPYPGDKIIGYTVNQYIQVKVRDTKKAGDLIAGAGDRGATDISSLAFTIDDDSNAKAEARAKAVADAKKKAQQLADTLGVRLVRLTSFYEENNGGPYPMVDKQNETGFVATSAPVAPQVPVGENTISSAVNLTYEIE